MRVIKRHGRAVYLFVEVIIIQPFIYLEIWFGLPYSFGRKRIERGYANPIRRAVFGVVGLKIYRFRIWVAQTGGHIGKYLRHWCFGFGQGWEPMGIAVIQLGMPAYAKRVCQAVDSFYSLRRIVIILIRCKIIEMPGPPVLQERAADVNLGLGVHAIKSGI